ncbi:DUF1295 domain-containing protein [Hyphobacterium sp. CCMP332]|nr:DUF1295 domain-containing protein [Hyphobacterium sp. CCMP332]
MIDLIQYLALGVLIYVSLFYILATIIKNWSIIDIVWGPGFVLIAIMAIIYTRNYNIFSLTISALVTLWALRLAFHIGIRNIGKGEDFRYANWRKKWQPHPEIQGYFRVFILQGIIMLIVSLPIYVTIKFSSTDYSFIYFIPGILIFFIGFILEVSADLQLRNFKKDDKNSGHLINSGLWSISRHPNYLGEIILWWGIGFFSLPFEYGYLGLLGALCIHLIIRFISIPVLEEKWKLRKDWKEIEKDTSILFPYLKKKPS